MIMELASTKLVFVIDHHQQVTGKVLLVNDVLLVTQERSVISLAMVEPVIHAVDTEFAQIVKLEMDLANVLRILFLVSGLVTLVLFVRVTLLVLTAKLLALELINRILLAMEEVFVVQLMVDVNAPVVMEHKVAVVIVTLLLLDPIAHSAVMVLFLKLVFLAVDMVFAIVELVVMVLALVNHNTLILIAQRNAPMNAVVMVNAVMVLQELLNVLVKEISHHQIVYCVDQMSQVKIVPFLVQKVQQQV